MRSSKGFTLIELLLTLGVVAMLLVGVFVVYPQVRTKLLVNQELAGYRAIVASLRVLYPRPPYTGMSSATLRAANLIPSTFELPEGSNAVRNVWGGTVNIVAWGDSDTVPGGASRVRLISASIPQEACIGMSQGFFEYADQAYVAPTGQAPWQPSYLVKSDDPALLAQLCSAENTGGFTLGIFFKP